MLKTYSEYGNTKAAPFRIGMVLQSLADYRI